MKITVNIDDSLIEKASRLTGINETAELVRLALEGLIEQKKNKRLAELGGTEKGLRPIKRRR